MTENKKLFFLGFGNAAADVFNLAFEYGTKYATTRNRKRLEELTSLSLNVILLEGSAQDYDLEAVGRASRGAHVLVSFPPDGVSDEILSAALVEPSKVVYISSTGVFGEKSGVIDDTVEPDYNCETAIGRINAEKIWSELANTVILRAPALYGPSYGLHKSLAAGKFKLPGDGSRYTSRIHLSDLARIILKVFEADIEYGAYNVGDLKPATQLEVVSWLCEKMDIEMPESKELSQVHHTLRANRQIDSSRLLKALDLTLTYPTYVEGFENCLGDTR